MPDLIREEIATGAHEERSDLNTNIQQVFLTFLD